MAIDTAIKRQSAIFFGCPIFPQTILPDGTISQADRQDILWTYRAITASAVQYVTLLVELVSITDYDVLASITDYGVSITEKNRL